MGVSPTPRPFLGTGVFDELKSLFDLGSPHLVDSTTTTLYIHVKGLK